MIAVIDNGIGIPPESCRSSSRSRRRRRRDTRRRARHRADARARHRRAARRHGRGERGPGNGQPLRGAPAARGRTAGRGRPARGRAAPPGMRVLVADDNRDAADTLCRMLALYGHDVRRAYDGAAAIEVCEAFRPHVAVLDIGMPVRERLRGGARAARAARRGAALIALTGWGGRRRAARPRSGLRPPPRQARSIRACSAG